MMEGLLVMGTRGKHVKVLQHLNRYPVPEWVHQQVYLNPHPRKLILRNHAWVFWSALTPAFLAPAAT